MIVVNSEYVRVTQNEFKSRAVFIQISLEDSTATIRNNRTTECYG